ncbi:hypothetical protein ACTD5D_28130 [Nocardia takedensis]|uniref:hypothetical protein n=1 Tax=Nocardia takedensis TaxID=259390 RepID=UPI0002D41035|nr:hypothetical protein [Nocardia takedensis]
MYVPLLVTPLAAGVVIALTTAAPLTTLVSDRSRTAASRILLSVSVFVPLAFVYWLVGGALAKGVSAPMARGVGDVPREVFEHYYHASYVPQNTIWSLVESIVLAVAILVVYVVMILRRPSGERSPLPRAVAGVVVVTIVVGALFAGNAVRAYDDLGLFGG